MSNIFSRLKIQDIFDRDPDKFEPRPRRAWAVIFSVMVVLIFLMLVAHFYFYFYMRTDSSFKSDESVLITNEAKLNRKGLGEITAMFEAKNAKFQELLASPSKIADPSVGHEHIDSSAISTTTAPEKKPSVKKEIGTAPTSFE